jgi:hypothetical protein
MASGTNPVIIGSLSMSDPDLKMDDPEKVTQVREQTGSSRRKSHLRVVCLLSNLQKAKPSLAGSLTGQRCGNALTL